MKAFLLFQGLDQSQWAKTLNHSRSGYASLRDHFLKYIDHPDDLDSTVDPLTEDDNVSFSIYRGELGSDF